MKAIKSASKLYLHYFLIMVQGEMQYKKSFFLTVCAQFLVSFNVFVGINFLFLNFHEIKGFAYFEIVLCYSIFLMGYSLAEGVGRGFTTLPTLIRSGEFDRILARPRSLILQVMGSRCELTRFGRLLQAVATLIYGLAISEIEWSLLRVITFILMIVSTFFLMMGIFLLFSGISFFTIEGSAFINIFVHGSNEFGRYPVSVYGKSFLRFATFVIPYALVQYYPLLYLIGRTEQVVYAFFPLLSYLFLIPCYLVWRFGVKHYASSGS